MTADGGVLHHLDVILRDLGGRGRCAGRRGGPRTPRRRPRPQAPATGCFGIPEGGIDLSWGDLWGHKSVNERPRPGAHIPDTFLDELEENGCKALVEGRDWSCERTRHDRASLVMKTVFRACVYKNITAQRLGGCP